MPDQLLRAHEVMEYVYNVADVAYPVSIRDQMNRACWLVQRAVERGFFGPRRDMQHRRLLVCGAGAAGVSAAIHAVDLGIETVLVERSAAPFRRQRLCRSRWLDPAQYDWSADFWTFGHFPYPASPRMPLPWPGNRSNLVALGWRGPWLAARANPLLTFRRRNHLVGVPTAVTTPAGSTAVQIHFAKGPPEEFGMVLWCIGFGDERRAAPPGYQGFAFWETDPFERPNWGTGSLQQNLRALVSGGGDGALQDVIRLTTRRKSALDVYQALGAGGWKMPAEVRHTLFTAEDQAQRALLWCGPRSIDEHRALQQLHSTYADVVDYLVTAEGNRAKLIAEVQKFFSANPHPVLLIHPCTHFARCYGLNHFLVLLLARVTALSPVAPGHGSLTVWQQTGLDQVIGDGHVCAGSPWACHGQDHQIFVQSLPSCHLSIPGATTALNPRVQVVVLRHGITTPAPFAATPLAFARQVMPYHLPGP